MKTILAVLVAAAAAGACEWGDWPCIGEGVFQEAVKRASDSVPGVVQTRGDSYTVAGKAVSRDSLKALCAEGLTIGDSLQRAFAKAYMAVVLDNLGSLTGTEGIKAVKAMGTVLKLERVPDYWSMLNEMEDGTDLRFQ
jgi:hypothetical protein